MQVLRKRFVSASRDGCPWRHSTSTTVGTTGGHSCADRSDRISASARGDRSARRLTPPLSRTSTLPGLAHAAFPDSLGDRLSARQVPPGGFPHFVAEVGEVLVYGFDGVPPLQLRRQAGQGSAVDALIVTLAEPGGTVLTGDRADLEALTAYAHDVGVELV